MKSRIPAYCLHKASGQAFCRVSGKMRYLGPHGSPESKAAYARVVAELAASGPAAVAMVEAGEPITVVELCAAYLDHAERYYQRDGQPTAFLDHIKWSMRPLEDLYGGTLASEFGPRKLKAIQAVMEAGGKLNRATINRRVGIIKRIFAWGVSEELVPPTVKMGLDAVDGLRKGRCAAAEPRDVQPVADEVVDATLPHLPEVVGDMVRFQRLTGARPGEVCLLRPMDVDRSADVWAYRPTRHKTELHGKARTIFIGPQAQEILLAYLLRPADAFCFSPRESVDRAREARHAARKTPLSCGNKPGSNRKRTLQRQVGEQYTKDAYRRAIVNTITRANERAKRAEAKAAKKEGREPVDVPRIPPWHPNQLRHTAATKIRKAFGLEAAQVILGHSKADVTQVYAERDKEKAIQVIRKIG